MDRILLLQFSGPVQNLITKEDSAKLVNFIQYTFRKHLKHLDILELKRIEWKKLRETIFTADISSYFHPQFFENEVPKIGSP